MAGAGFANTGMAAYALGGHRLCSETVTDDLVKLHIWRGLVIALTFVVSLALLPLGPAVVELSWMSLAVTQRIVHAPLRTARPGVTAGRRARLPVRSSPNLGPKPLQRFPIW